MKRLEKILHGADFAVRIISIGGGIATVGLFIFILWAIASRVLHLNFEGQVEISEIFLAAIACCSLGFAMLERTHVRVEALFERLPPRWQKAVEGFNLIVAMAFFGVISWATASSAYEYWARMIFTEGTLAIPKWIASGLISFGCLIMVLALLILFVRLITVKSEREG